MHDIGWSPAHPVGSTLVRRMTMDATVRRTAMVRHRTGAPHPMSPTAPDAHLPDRVHRRPAPLSGSGRANRHPLSDSERVPGYPLSTSGRAHVSP
ncbi:hypothetical protein ACH4RG_35245 [Streptomyces sp. NPDC021019]|uniref:hypothetical protein n=1 Tax=Streptomyces sp. NPDC021019 TaxID=3365108 RepID=UPI003797D4F7